MTDAVTRRLDAVIAILKLAHRDEIERARKEIRSDPVKRAILDAATDWIQAGKLTKTVTRKTKRSPRSVRDHVGQLVEDSVLEKAGGGPTTKYKTTGLI